MLFTKETPVPADAVTEARSSVEKLASALAAAETESSEARTAYDSAMHEFVAKGVGKATPSLEGQRIAEAKVESLTRLLAEARARLARAVRQADDDARVAAIQASGSEVARLSAAAEAKVAEFEAAITTVRRIETELFEALFSRQSGLQQPFGDSGAEKDARWCRHRLAFRAIESAEKGHCLIDARFEIDGNDHLGLLETRFYRRALTTGI